MDAEKLADGLFEATRRYFAREIAARDAAIASLEARIAAIPSGKDGRDGKDGAPGDDGQTPSIDLPALALAAAALIPAPKDGRHGADGASVKAEDLEPLLGRLVASAMAALPVPRDGRDGERGRDGESVSLEVVRTLVEVSVANAVAALPPAVNGKDGQPGRNGADGTVGKDGQNGKDGATPIIDLHEVAEIIRSDPEAIALLRGERGEPGARGDPGQHGADGANGRDGVDGAVGKDGASVTPEQLREAVRQRFDGWAIEFERIATDRQRAAMDSIPLPRDGRDGERGRDGFGMDDFDFAAASPDGRNLMLQIAAGGRVRSAALKLPTIIDRGTYSPSACYEAGDAFTYGGSLWITQKDAPKGKPGESPDFRLAVRRGRDGKEA